MKDLLRRFGGCIKEIQKAFSVTQETLAERIEMSPRYLSRIQGGHQSPSVEMLAKLADTLEVKLWEFLTLANQERSRNCGGRCGRSLKEPTRSSSA